MFKKLITFVLALAMLFSMCSCKKNKVKNEDIVVVNDETDINMAIGKYDTLNPFETTLVSVMNLMNIVYEPLFTFDEKMNIVPVLAKGYAMSEDGRRITVDLREDVKWHNGTVFSSDDVTYTLSKLVNSAKLYKDTAKKISGFTATAKNQVVIDLYGPEIDFAYFLTFPIMCQNASYSSGDDFEPVGTGSYRFASKSETELCFEPNLEWHDNNTSKKKIIVKLVKDDVSVAQTFNVNETDVVTSNEIGSTDLAPKSNAVSMDMVSQNLVFLGFNTAKENLTAGVREAIGLLVDKQEIVDKCAYGYGKICDFSINPESWAYQKISGLDKSKEKIAKCLKSDGFALNDGFYEKDGEPLKCSVLVNNDNQTRLAVANTLADNLKSLGIDASVSAVDYNSYIAKIRNDEFDMFVGEVKISGFLNPVEMLDKAESYFNFDASGITDAVSSLYGCDKDSYGKKANAAAKRFYENLPYVPLYFKTQTVYYGSYVSGISKPILSDAYKDIEKWYYYSNDKNDGEKKDD